MPTIVNADCGQVLGIVDGRDSASVAAWLAIRSQAWRDRIEVVAIDPSAPFKKAIREQLPNALVSVDGFHLVHVRHEVLCVRMGVRDPCRSAVAAAGLKLRAA
jgi:transposase